MDYLRSFKLLNRKKTDPYSFIYTGDQTNISTDIQLFEYDSASIREVRELAAEDVGELNESEGFQWLNIYGLNDTELIASLCKKQGIDNLVIQDILDMNQRPKFQEFDDYSFLTIKSTTPDSSKLNIEQMSFIFNHHFLISFQEKQADHFEHLRVRLRENKGLIRKKGPDFLLYTMLEALLDNHFKTLENVNQEIRSLNLNNIKTNPSPAVLEDIESLKVFVQFIKSSIQPIREFAQNTERNPVPFIAADNLKYFSEIKDLCLTLIDNCDTLLTSLESSINLFFSVQGHKMNQIMKTLTIVATVFIPLTFVAGIYGMNFKHMPELEWQYGYFAVWGLMLIMLIVMIFYFRKKRWF